MNIKRNIVIVSGLLVAVLVFGAWLSTADSAKPAKPGPDAELQTALVHLDKVKKAIEAGEKKAALIALQKATASVTAVYKTLKRPEVVNNKCPIMGGKVNPAKVPDKLFRKFKNQGVGFCCAGCPQAWDKLSEGDKAKKLEKVTKK